MFFFLGNTSYFKKILKITDISNLKVSPNNFIPPPKVCLYSEIQGLLSYDKKRSPKFLATFYQKIKYYNYKSQS